MRCGLSLLLPLLLVLLPPMAHAQAAPRSPQEEIAKLQWDVRQLHASRAQCEQNISQLGVELDKAQAELKQLKETPKDKK